MRFLLAHNSLYYPSAGGGDKSNRLLMEALAARGHAVRVVTRVEEFGQPAHEAYLRDLAERQVTPVAAAGRDVEILLNGVHVYTLTRDTHWRPYFQSHIDDFDPDIIVTSTDDPALLLFDLAVRTPRARVVYLVRATIAVPFGPDSSGPHAERTQQLRQADGVVGVSNYVAEYCRRWGGLEAVHVPISLLEPGPAPLLGKFENPYVLMVNPCAVKGLSIVLGLADALPQVQFGAVPSWGTTNEDLAELGRRPNIHVLARVDNIDDLLAKACVTLVPSIWAEARSRMVLESMSRGVPVIGANVGGLHEAMLGVPYLLPVNPIVRYKGQVDEHMVPVAEVPPQDVRPWVETLQRLREDAQHWQEISALSRSAALQYLENLNVVPFEGYCAGLLERAKRGPMKVVTNNDPLAKLSPEKRLLLERKLKKKAGETAAPAVQAAKKDVWFPEAGQAPEGSVRLFLFPFAGGGAAAFSSWKPLAGRLHLCPAHLPGREERAGEEPVGGLQELVQQALPSLATYTQQPYLLGGHSMGAGLAFEMARAIRAAGLPLPQALVVSSLRPPAERRVAKPWQPEPSDEELMAQLRRLGGVPEAVLQRESLRETILAVMRTDTRMVRNYVCAPPEPFAIPILAMGGSQDPQVTEAQLQKWGEETTGPFQLRMFPGGHFYWRSQAVLPEVLAAIAELATE